MLCLSLFFLFPLGTLGQPPFAGRRGPEGGPNFRSGKARPFSPPGAFPLCEENHIFAAIIKDPMANQDPNHLISLFLFGTLLLFKHIFSAGWSLYRVSCTLRWLGRPSLFFQRINLATAEGIPIPHKIPFPRAIPSCSATRRFLQSLRTFFAFPVSIPFSLGIFLAKKPVSLPCFLSGWALLQHRREIFPILRQPSGLPVAFPFQVLNQYAGRFCFFPIPPCGLYFGWQVWSIQLPSNCVTSRTTTPSFGQNPFFFFFDPETGLSFFFKRVGGTPTFSPVVLPETCFNTFCPLPSSSPTVSRYRVHLSVPVTKNIPGK